MPNPNAISEQPKCNKDQVLVQLDAPRNERIMFDPLQTILFAGFKQSQASPGEKSQHGNLHKLPDLPGAQIFVDAAKGEAMILDPLGYDGFRGALSGLNGVRRGSQDPEIQPGDTRHYKLNEEQTATWLFHLGNIVFHKKQGRVVGGDLKAVLDKQPEEKIRVDCWQNIIGEPRYLHELRARDTWGPHRWWKKLYGETEPLPNSPLAVEDTMG